MGRPHIESIYSLESTAFPDRERIERDRTSRALLLLTADKRVENTVFLRARLDLNDVRWNAIKENFSYFT